MTGREGCRSRQWRKRASPSIFGIRMSEMSTSVRFGFAARNEAAWVPSAASVTSYPSRTSIARRTRRKFRSSSAIRIFPLNGSSPRQLDGEPAPLPGSALDGDGSPVLLHDPAADGQPHPHAALASGEERTEQLQPIL